MADFKTHVGIATGAGTVAGIGLVFAGLASIGSLPWLVATVALGGIMPDVDSDHSTSVRLIFTLLGLAAAAGALLWPPINTGWTGVLCLALGGWIVVRDISSLIFKHYSRHRANWHSLVAVAWISLLTVALTYRYGYQPASSAWLLGGAMAFGMLVHLTLDECFSVDLAGQRIKRSFGTALKLYDPNHRPTALLMCVLAVGTYPWLPALPNGTGISSLWLDLLAIGR